MEYSVGEVVVQLEKTVNSFVSGGSILLRFYERSDLVQELYLHFLEKGFLEKYDASITSFKYFIARAAKNYLIDLTRKRRHLMLSLNKPVGEAEDCCEMVDLFEGKLFDVYASLYLDEVIENCSEEQISPNYSLSWKELLFKVLEGQTPQDIRKTVGISSGRISQLVRELQGGFRLWQSQTEAC